MFRSVYSRPLLFVAVTAALTACRGGNSMVSTVPIEPGEECEAGGIRLLTGIDDDKDGTLTGDEIEESVVLCDGAAGEVGASGSEGTDGFTSLVRTETLPPGDEDCPAGGTRVLMGLDNGDGGDTAADGVLGDGEVDSSELVCDGQSSMFTDSTVVPPGSAGTSVLRVNGGHSSIHSGADAGQILLYGSDDNAGHLKVFATGELDTSFEVPERVVDLGPNPLVLSGAVDIRFIDASGSTTPSMSDGEVVYYWNGSTGYVATYSGSQGISAASGIHIESDAVVTFTDATEPIELDLYSDLVVDGTLTVEATSRQDLILAAPSVWVGPTGTIDLSATSTAVSKALSLHTNHDWGVVVIEGTLDVSGGPSSADAQTMEFVAASGVYITGQLRGAGGSQGGDGGRVVVLTEEQGPIYLDGLFDFSGGDSSTSTAGDGGQLLVIPQGPSAVRIAGTIDIRGGSSTEGNGGRGGAAYLFSIGAPFASSAEFNAAGGNGDSSNPINEQGGDGGIVFMSTISDQSGRSGRIDISSSIHVHGGDAMKGGAGGAINIGHSQAVQGIAPIALYGFASLEAMGGNATRTGGSGGSGGAIHLAYGKNDVVASGGIFNQAALYASGGLGIDADGGKAGEIALVCGDEFTYPTCFVHQEGEVVARSGITPTLQGPQASENFIVEAQSYFHQLAPVNLSGLDAGGSAGAGSYGAQAVISALGEVIWQGDLTLTGGNAADPNSDGGDAGQLSMSAYSLNWSGSMLAAGGVGGSNAEPGAGGLVLISTLTGNSVLDIPTGTASSGPNGHPQLDGHIVVDGVDITSTLTAP